jgi:hypothetical protein
MISLNFKHFEVRIGENSNGWVELFDPPLITTDKTHYFILLPSNDSKSGPFRQIAKISIKVCIILMKTHQTIEFNRNNYFLYRI